MDNDEWSDDGNADRLLSMVATINDAKVRTGQWSAPISAFNEAMYLNASSRLFGFFQDATPAVSPLRQFALAADRLDSFEVLALRCTTAKASRGLLAQRYASNRYLFEHSLLACRAGRIDTSRRLVSWMPGPQRHTHDGRVVLGRWIDVSTQEKLSAWPLITDEWEMQLVVSAALSAQYEWRVALRSEGHNFALSLGTTPTGVRNLLRTRDMEPGKARRAALRHWVSAHTRSRPTDSDPDAVVWVRRHLRGRTEFSLEGVRGVVIPAPADIEEAARL